MSGRNRIVLGRTADVRDGAVHTASPWRGAFAAHDWSKMARAVVERVRRQFGNNYARVASAYFRRKKWEAAKVPRRTFFHALKKVKLFLEADKHWSKTMSGGSRRRNSLH